MSPPGGIIADPPHPRHEPPPGCSRCNGPFPFALPLGVPASLAPRCGTGFAMWDRLVFVGPAGLCGTGWSLWDRLSSRSWEAVGRPGDSLWRAVDLGLQDWSARRTLLLSCGTRSFVGPACLCGTGFPVGLCSLWDRLSSRSGLPVLRGSSFEFPFLECLWDPGAPGFRPVSGVSDCPGVRCFLLHRSPVLLSRSGASA
jgi:hypothetical protein